MKRKFLIGLTAMLILVTLVFSFADGNTTLMSADDDLQEIWVAESEVLLVGDDDIPGVWGSTTQSTDEDC